MQLLPILLVAVIMAVDGGLKPLAADWGLSHAAITWIAIAPTALIVVVTWIFTGWCERRLRRGDFPGPMISADRMGRYARLLIAANHVLAVVMFGWLQTVRTAVGNPVLLDEFITLLPALLGIVGTWWAYFPIDKRLHNATIISQLDDGRPMYPMLTRYGFVLLQIRMQLLLVLVPVLMIATMAESIHRTSALYLPPSSIEWFVPLAKLIAAACIFMLAPLMARLLLDVTPMAPGALRDALINVCRAHNVRIRELLVWNTNGRVYNAAVMGLFGPLRYIMITDALLEAMHLDQMRAVMAHEIGHVRRRHMPWMVVVLFACFAFMWYVFEWPLHLVNWSWTSSNSQAVGLASGVVQMIGGLALFGWICRRFERQADTFAVQHLSMEAQAEPNSVMAPQVTHRAVYLMSGALDSIARLNTIDLERPSWRHGSIAWRMRYLFTIIGLPVSQLPIDRKVFWLKFVSLTVLILAMTHAFLIEWYGRGGIT